MATPTAITRFTPVFKPLTNITPFTFRDGYTFLEMYEALRAYLTENLSPEIDGKLTLIYDEVQAQVVALANDVNASKDAWQALFDQFMADVVAQLEALNDQAASNLVNNPESLLHAALNGMFVKRGEYTLSVTDFGAVGDGVTDDNDAVVATFEHAATLPHAKIIFPPGKYLMSEPFSGIGSNQTVSGYGAEIIITAGTAIDVAGEGVGEPLNLMENANRGDSVISVSKSTLKSGDVVKIVSQRVSTSIDAPASDRLGSETGDGSADNGPYFGEYSTVESIDSSLAGVDVITLSTSLIYNGYRVDATQETTSDRPNAMLYPVNPIRDTLIEGFKLNTQSGVTIRTNYAYNVEFRNITDVKDSNYGTSLYFQNSYMCKAYDIKSRFTYKMPAAGNINQRNVFKLIGSQDIDWVRCETYLASQSIDVTYNRTAALITSQRIRFIECKTVGSSNNAATTHPGTSDIDFLNCDFSSGQSTTGANGLGIRSPRTTVRGCKLMGTLAGGTAGNTGNYGINLFDGANRDCVIVDNYVEGFDRGIFITDGSGIEKFNTTLKNIISNNKIVNCFQSFGTSRATTNENNPNWEIMFSNNMISSSISGAIGVWVDVANGGSRGYTLNDNHFFMTSSSATAFVLSHNSADISIQGNKLTASSTAKFFMLARDVTNVYINMYLTLIGNQFRGGGNHGLPLFQIDNTLIVRGNNFPIHLPLFTHDLDLYGGEYELPQPSSTIAVTGNKYPGDGPGMIRVASATGDSRQMQFWPLSDSGVPRYRFKPNAAAFGPWKLI